MTAHPAAALLAADLGRLPRTNARGEQGLIHIPGFLSTTGMSDEQAGDAGLLAQAIAEGVIEDLEKHGYLVLTKSEIKAKVQALAAEKQSTGEVVLHCNRCRRPVVKVDAGADMVKVHVQSVVAGLSAHLEQCR